MDDIIRGLIKAQAKLYSTIEVAEHIRDEAFMADKLPPAQSVQEHRVRMRRYQAVQERLCEIRVNLGNGAR